METTYAPEGVTHVKFLGTASKPRLRRLNIYIEEADHQDIVSIAAYERMDVSSTVRELISLGLRYYKFKRGAFNPNTIQNTKMFFCQVCGQECKIRKQYTTVVLNEEYKFCEDCFFAKRYVPWIITFVSRS